MQLQKLKLFNFKNYEEAELVFSDKIQCFLGNNGSGKTNLLDAIHYLAFTKSAVNPSDSQNIRQGQMQFVVKGNFLLESRKEKEVICSFQQGQKKIVREDGTEYLKFSEHVGKYPAVLIAPQDIEIIWDGSGLRRKFFDSLISQLDKAYLDSLITYANHLKQRNSLLRMFSESGKVDYDLLASYDSPIIQAGKFIHKLRKEFLIEFLPLFKQHYHFLAGDAVETVDILYRSDLETSNFEELLKRNLQRDIILQRTSSGIHRDDFSFILNNGELKRFGSQGQQKSFLIGLKLAEFQSISERKGFKPLLLLDDIFDKLDDLRIHKLMLLIADGSFGQLFITDARKGRSKEILNAANLSAELFTIENGIFRIDG
ncbi:MAG: DNA replication and repair protein RecF [Bacteroidia bacterium]|nr:DNA replication and repair protein RecF [Bacteroidia bacterium]